MTRAIAVLMGLTLGVLGVLGALAMTGQVARGAMQPAVAPFVLRDTAPAEFLLLVVGGSFDSKAAADAANAQMVFGDLQGYYVVPTNQFAGLREQLGKDWALVSAFRTTQGAQEFADLAGNVFGMPATILPVRVMSLGGVYAGLGQESAPNGLGPLTYPVAESLES